MSYTYLMSFLINPLVTFVADYVPALRIVQFKALWADEPVRLKDVLRALFPKVLLQPRLRNIVGVGRKPVGADLDDEKPIFSEHSASKFARDVPKQKKTGK
jgi:hypothetical protein